MAGTIATAYVEVLPSTQGITSNLEEAFGGAGEKAGEKGGKLAGASFVGKIGKFLAAAGATKVITDFFKSAINQGAELQQNIGGTEAVFGKAATDITSRAKQAYKNMGLSASDYMATANKMGALFQGSGMKQVESMQLTTKAMQRAADVASVMGVDMQMAMDSVAGAAKGNFRMMDNLGVAMDATTLQAYALEKGINFDWNTASQAEKSRLAMEMFFDRTSQYAGNFARESEETISGSLGMMKASWSDFMAKLALGEDVTGAMRNVVKSVLTVGQNILPVVGNILTGIGSLLGEGFQLLGGKIAEFGKTAWNGFKTATAVKWNEIKTDLAGDWTNIKSTVSTSISAIGKFMSNGWQSIKRTSSTKWGEITSDLSGDWARIKTGFSETWSGIGEALSKTWDDVKTSASEKWALITSDLSSDCERIKTGFSETWSGITESASGTWDILKASASEKWAEITSDLSGDWENIKAIASDKWDNISNSVSTAWSGVSNTAKATWSTVSSFLTQVWSGLRDKAKGAFDKVSGVVSDTWSTIKGGIAGAWNAIKEAVQKAWDTVASIDWSTVEGAVFDVWTAIEGAVSGAWDLVKQAVQKAWDNVTSIDFGSIAGKVSDAWGEIEGAVGDAWDAIKKAVSDKIEEVKGLLKFEWTLPEITLPEIPTITVQGVVNWVQNGLSALGLPTPKTRWNAVAMDQPYLFSGATLFGAGEAGDEVLYGRAALMRDIQSAVNDGGNSNASVLSALDRIDQHLDRLGIYLDGDTLVGGLAAGMNEALGGLDALTQRGLA